MELKQLFDKYGCDKSSKHHYHTVYEDLFKSKQNDKINFLEIGVWKGASTLALEEYFQNGIIYGIDLFVRNSIKEIPISNKRIKLFQGDSTKFSDYLRFTDTYPAVEFDFILDDGAHYPEANMLSFRYFSPLLKSGGIYIIEDVWPLDIMNEDEIHHSWLLKYPERYDILKYFQFIDELKKTGWKINRYDLRKQSKEPDSYIFTIEKP